MPVRYVQSIYKQYTLFLKDSKAQEGAAAEDMIEELEDSAMYSGNSQMGDGTSTSSNTNKQMSPNDRLAQLQMRLQNAREEALDNE